MINFFRRIRKKLADDNKPWKYMRYAIGEIVLVVIGILIALYINNWNEERKQEIQTKKLMTQTTKELLYNIGEANNVIDYYFTRDSLVYKVIKRKVTADDYQNNFRYKELPWDYRYVGAVDNDFMNLIENGSIISPEQDSIISDLKNLYTLNKKVLEDWDNYVIKLARDFKDKIKEEHSWFSDHRSFVVTDEMTEYFLNDDYYFNAIHDVAQISYRLHLSRTIYFRQSAGESYEQITNFLGLDKDSIVSRNHNDFNHYLGFYKQSNNGTLSINIEKDRDNNLILKWINNDSIYGKNKIYPYSRTHFWEILDTQYTQRAFQLFLDEQNNVKGLFLVGFYGRGDDERLFYEKMN